jgi:hypothetical protein
VSGAWGLSKSGRVPSPCRYGHECLGDGRHWGGSCAVAGSEGAAGGLRVADAMQKRVWRCDKRGAAARDGGGKDEIGGQAAVSARAKRPGGLRLNVVWSSRVRSSGTLLPRLD